METLNDTKCKYSSENDKCNSKCCDTYGGFCKKHRKLFLLKDESIILNRFTCDERDYTLKELSTCYTTHINSKKPSKYRKHDYFQEIVKLSENTKRLLKNEPIIIKLQARIRKNIIKSRIMNQGVAILNRDLCNNDEDFYSYDSKWDIDDLYFYSYKDANNNYWCFDIRSLKKLLEMNYGNPYSTEPIPLEIKDSIMKRIELLDKIKIQTEIPTTVITDRRSAVKQKIVDLFSQIEYSGYSCDVNWFQELNSVRLKRLYRELEDIWNYRANLSNEVKIKIAPPNGRLFVMPVSDYMLCNSKLELQEIVINELTKILGATSQSDMNLGFMYFIIALSIVSRPCYLIHRDWVQYVFG